MNISLKFKIIADKFKEGTDKTEKLKSCIHSGNAGDIIYSLPAVKALGAEHFIMNTSNASGSGARFLDEKTALSLMPLLLSQPYIKRVSIVFMHNPFPPYFKTENGIFIVTPIPLEYMDGYLTEVDFILDKFRLTDTNNNHLALSYSHAFGLRINPAEKWLFIGNAIENANHDKKLPNIVLAFTPRYRSKNKDFWAEALEDFKNKYNIDAVGTKNDFDCVSGIADNFITCADFLELADIINRADLFIGNPSMPYAVAEGLKVPRIVEIPDSPRNAYPLGMEGYIAPESIEDVKNLIDKILKTSML